MSNNDTSHEFAFYGGVRQGCIICPRLLCSVLQLAMGSWRNQGEHFGLKANILASFFSAGSRFWTVVLGSLQATKGLLYWPVSGQRKAKKGGWSYFCFGDLRRRFDALVTCLEQVGLKLNASKTKIARTQAQPPSTLTTPPGCKLEVLQQTKTHKWPSFL